MAGEFLVLGCGGAGLCQGGGEAESLRAVFERKTEGGVKGGNAIEYVDPSGRLRPCCLSCVCYRNWIMLVRHHSQPAYC